MYIRSLQLSNFRNYSELSLKLNKGVNIFYGNNAQGKTNILEAVYIAAASRSYKGSREKDIIKQGENESHIRLDLTKASEEYRIDVHLKRNKSKGIAVDLVPLKRARDLLGILNVVIFAPEDLGIVKNGPSARRRYINNELCQADPVYFKDLSDYIKCLEQRNKLLKDMDDDSSRAGELDVWDMQLVSIGKKVISARRAFIEEMNGIICDIHSEITGGAEKIKLSYENDVDEDNFEEELSISRNKDIRFGTTSRGPHRDDMAIFVNGSDLRVFGSQGQIRSGALSLKLSEIKMIKNKTGHVPVLLLDDVLSELDTGRQNLLLSGIEGMQTLITCTGLDEFINNNFREDSVFYVSSGTVTPGRIV